MSVMVFMLGIDRVCLMCSSCEWIAAGDPANQAKIRGLLVPSYETRMEIERLRKESPEISTINAPVFGFDGNFEVCLCQQTSWHSYCCWVYPGEYFLMADVEFKSSFQDMLNSIIPPDHIIHHYPWMLGRQNNKSAIYFQCSSVGQFTIEKRPYRELPPNNIDLSLIDVTEVRRPFLVEMQSDISSLRLVNMLDRLQQEAMSIKAEYQSLQREIESKVEEVRVAKVAGKRIPRR